MLLCYTEHGPATELCSFPSVAVLMSPFADLCLYKYTNAVMPWRILYFKKNKWQQQKRTVFIEKVPNLAVQVQWFAETSSRALLGERDGEGSFLHAALQCYTNWSWIVSDSPGLLLVRTMSQMSQNSRCHIRSFWRKRIKWTKISSVNTWKLILNVEKFQFSLKDAVFVPGPLITIWYYLR